MKNSFVLICLCLIALFVSGENNLHAREYDPEIGRFASMDPYLGDLNTPQSLHRYLYVYGNPTRFVDLDGRKVYVTDEQRKKIETYYGKDNVRYTEHSSGLFGLGETIYEVAVTKKGIQHFANYVRENDMDSGYAKRLSLSIVDPFWLYEKDLTASRKNAIWIGQEYEGKSIGGPGYNPWVIVNPDGAPGYANVDGFHVPFDFYKNTTEYIGKEFLRRVENFVLEHGMDIMLLTIALLDAVPGDESVAFERGFLRNASRGRSLRTRSLSQTSIPARLGSTTTLSKEVEIINSGAFKGSTSLVDDIVASKKTAGHHTIPQYMGGRKNQTLANLADDVHGSYHEFLDNWNLPAGMKPRSPAPKSFGGEVRPWGRENAYLREFASESKANREFIVDNLRKSLKEHGTYSEVKNIFEKEAKIFIGGSD